MPQIREELECVIPTKLPVIDLYLFARRLGLNAGLKTIENTLGIPRREEWMSKRGAAIKLRRQFLRGGARALERLLAYNRENTIDLYPLAELLVRKAREANGITRCYKLDERGVHVPVWEK